MNKVRNKYLETVSALIKSGENLVIVTSDYAGPALDEIRQINNGRYVSAGIAEQDMIAIVSGLALSGQRAIAYGIAPFPCIRAVDQIRNAVSMMHLPISIVSIGVGISPSGPTHYCVEDISIIRAIPGIRIINVTDETMAKKAAELSLTTQEPLYIRIDKYSDGVLYKDEDINFKRGFSVVKEGHDIALISGGFHINRMIDLSKKLSENGITIKVIDLYSLPFNSREFIKEIQNCAGILTVEEHVREGGIGSAVLEALNDNEVLKRVKRLGLDFKESYPDEFGSREYFMKKFHLDDDSISNVIKEMLG